MRNIILIFLQINFKTVLLYGTETLATTKREKSKIQAMVIKLLRTMLYKT